MLRVMVAVVALATSSSACRGQSCTLEARFSVGVTVLDGQGQPVPGAIVVFSVDGSREADCHGFGGSAYACGVESEGNFVVTARKAGYGDAHASVHVGTTDDGCHVESEHVTLTLTAS